jgi:membrane protease YdiL (CAAX protease family)
LDPQSGYRRLALVVALAPLLRILSFAAPVNRLPQIYWYAMVGVPFLIAVGLAGRLLNISADCIGFRVRSWFPHLLIALTGIPLSIAAFLILRPKPLFATLNIYNAVIAAIILFIFAAFTEEIYFRGLLLQVAGEAYGNQSILYSGACFAVMYIGSLSWAYVLFAAVIGVFWGWCARRAHSIWGPVLAHGTMIIGMALVWPYVWR